jgi:hypothetical protein
MSTIKKIKAEAPANKKIVRGDEEETTSSVRLTNRIQTAEKVKRDLNQRKSKVKSTSQE